MLEADDALDDAVFLSKRVITLSGAGKFVRAWSTAVRVHAGVPLCRFDARGLRKHFAPAARLQTLADLDCLL